MVGDGDLDDLETEGDRLGGEFGFNLEAATSRSHMGEESRAEDAIAGEQVAWSATDQDAKGEAHQDVAEPS